MQNAPQYSITKKFKKTIWHRFIGGCKDYDMIKSGDKIAVCISGGKDSFLLALCLRNLQKHSDVPFELEYLCMDPGYLPENRALIEENAQKLGINLTIFNTDIFDVVADMDKSPCYMCARMRRGHLYKNAKQLGCNKIALGHHFDDIVETTLMSMVWGAELKTMMPKLHSTNYEGMELLRPLCLVRESDIKAWVKYNALDFLRCACRMTERDPESENTGARVQAKRFVEYLRSVNPAADYNIFCSLHNVNLDMLPAYSQGGKKHSFLEKYDNKAKNINDGELIMQNFIPGTPLSYEKCENFRELGGYVGMGGKKVKRGIIYRTGALSKITTEKDVELFRSLGIKTVIDFRSSTERKADPNPVYDEVNYIEKSALYDADGNEIRLDLAAIFAEGKVGVEKMLIEVQGSYKHLPFNNPAYKILFKQLAENKTPLLFHCTAGKDRTGVAAALILRVLGVSDEDIIADYLVTNNTRDKSRRKFIEAVSPTMGEEEAAKLAQEIMGVKKELLQGTLNAIDERYDNFETYLLENCDVTKEMILSMRENLLED